MKFYRNDKRCRECENENIKKMVLIVVGFYNITLKIVMLEKKHKT